MGILFKSNLYSYNALFQKSLDYFSFFFILFCKSMHFRLVEGRFPINQISSFLNEMTLLTHEKLVSPYNSGCKT
ncbi:hypothetical protein D3C87_02010 [compost metagenome]